MDPYANKVRRIKNNKNYLVNNILVIIIIIHNNTKIRINKIIIKVINYKEINHNKEDQYRKINKLTNVKK